MLTFIILGGLWLISVAGGVGRAIFPSQGLDFTTGIASFAFIVALIWALSRKKPAAEDYFMVDFVRYVAAFLQEINS